MPHSPKPSRLPTVPAQAGTVASGVRKCGDDVAERPMSDTEQKKQQAARAALRYLQPDMIVGIGTGSTVNQLIELMGSLAAPKRPSGVISSSERTSALLQAAGFAVMDLNEVQRLPLYIDGADEATRRRQLVKGGGGALTREKIVAAAAEHFICIVDDGKLVDRLGHYPLPIEVIPMARNYVARRLTEFGGQPVWRQGFITDSGNHILDVHGLSIDDPVAMETTINQITGVVTCGLFAARAADRLLIGGVHGVEEL
jgi:ribose 5-phosphate isomerase A